ncbi:MULTISPECIES: SIMPL domain-containing protein [unclassified Aeromicrobium]|uniref:SIMPL domain-containing protein n=1 Tax=unclassified Aeromicrobium TaxID=2633570 RepID=UPI00288AF69D|nr:MULTISPECIES: SIMPL domain-containing protein [unclassified Aeromicrobium]
MGVQITVRGSAEGRFPAERALVRLEVVVEGADRQDVRDRAVALQEPLRSQLGELVSLGAVRTWSSDQVRVFSRHPWVDDRRSDDLVHSAQVQVLAEFVDFERLSGFVDHWSGQAGVEVQGLEWDLGVKSRRVHEAEVRKAAVDDAVTKAQSYADAVRRGRVTALELADPGMLDRPGDPGHGEPRAFALASADAGGAALDLVPADIVIRVEVDARFQAE